MSRQRVVAFALIVVVVTGLTAVSVSAADRSPGTPERGSRPATTRASSLRPLPPLARRCSVPDVRATTFRFRSRDGVLLDGALLGQGPVGVVLAHEAVGDLCRWVPYANILSQEGFRVLVFDYRDVGLSARVTGKREARIDDDVAGAITELRRRGATKVVSVGASLGGSAVLAAAASGRPATAGVVGISAPDSAFLRDGSGEYAALDPTAAAGRVRRPVLFLATKGDPFVPLAATGKLYRATSSRDKRLVVLPGYSHGVSIVDDPGATGSRARRLILEFIRARTGS